MQTILQIAAPVMIIAGALLTASNLGARITGIGFIAFTLGSILWLAIGLTVGPSSLVWQNIVLTLLNGFGIWRWLGRQRGIERGGEEASKVSEHLAGETLFPASHFAGAEVTGMDGSTLGKSVEAMIGCRSGKVAYLVVSDGGLAGVGETLRRLDWRDIDVAQDEFRSCHDQSGFSSLSSLERDHWPAR